SLSEDVKGRFRRLFRGAFYRRFVLGEWVAAEGTVYDFFDESYLRPVPQGGCCRYRVSCDYGTVNPTSMGLWGEREGTWYRLAEYYYDSRKEGTQKTDREYADALRILAGEREIQQVIVDPSAASFIEVLRRDGWRVTPGDNDVLAGIRLTGRLLKERKIVICETCAACIEEFSQYCWQERGDGRDCVRKTHDHAMDEIRYFAMTVEEQGDGFAACGVARRG
ncbi:MAG: PBSX family phage terminase large subunit, partial [Oscillospiraceae bacterium]